MILSHGGTSKIWVTQGTVLSGGANDEDNNYQEASVLYESSTFKMWLKHGWATPQLYYYTSSDGISWTAYGSNPLLAGAAVEQPFVFKDGSTYYLYTHASLAGDYKRYSSSDGISWNLDSASVLSLGTAGAWDDSQLGNMFVWLEGANDWRMIYEARRSGGAWKLGYATSSDGLTWSKSGSNPVLSETGSIGGPFVYKDSSGTYWMWAHRSVSSTLPTDLSRYKSTNLTSWTRNPVDNTLTRFTSDDGNTSTNGQIADPHLLEVNGQTYMYFEGNADGSQVSGHAHIKLVISRLPISQLVNTPEGY